MLETGFGNGQFLDFELVIVEKFYEAIPPFVTEFRNSKVNCTSFS